MPSGYIGQPDTGDVPVDTDCPECGSGEVMTSQFSAGAKAEGDIEQVSAWCESCGHGFCTPAEVSN